MPILHPPDAEQPDAKLIVEQLHDIASRATGGLRDTLEQAAAMLDAYQAGLVLATPHPCTGYVLVRAGCRAALGGLPAAREECTA